MKILTSKDPKTVWHHPNHELEESAWWDYWRDPKHAAVEAGTAPRKESTWAGCLRGEAGTEHLSVESSSPGVDSIGVKHKQGM